VSDRGGITACIIVLLILTLADCTPELPWDTGPFADEGLASLRCETSHSASLPRLARDIANLFPRPLHARGANCPPSGHSSR